MVWPPRMMDTEPDAILIRPAAFDSSRTCCAASAGVEATSKASATTVHRAFISGPPCHSRYAVFDAETGASQNDTPTNNFRVWFRSSAGRGQSFTGLEE